MTAPFTREDARRRGIAESHAVETWRGVVAERDRFASEYSGADAIAARRCAEVARRELEHRRTQSQAYERIARGEEPYP